MKKLLTVAAAALALSVTVASAQTNMRHSNARPLYDQLMTYSYGPLPLILGVAY